MNPSLMMFALLVATLLALASTGALLWLWRRRNAGSPAAADSEALRQELLLREASEQRLRGALQQYKRSAADFEQFAYAASHDLQTPLHNIEGFARLLERRSGDQLDDEARGFVAQILQGVQQTQKLVDALLQLSRIGRRDARIERRSLGEAFEQARTQLAGEIAQLDAQIVVPEWPAIEADHALLAQLFRNLIANALKYQPPGRTPRLTVHARAERDDWHLTFTDNGIGIPAEQVDHVFAPFHRLHSQAEFSGTGMGLAICRKIAAYHDGEIWAEPHDGGAQIHLLLPARARPQGTAAA
jgi:signal transduction histidine kinase